MASRLKSLLSEPLLHFLCIGAALYAASLLFAPDRRDPNTIVLGPAEYRHLSDLFLKERKRLPERAEMDEMVDLYVKSEALAREATALGLDNGDEIIRERLAQRMRFMLYASITIPPPSDDVVKAWIVENPDLYATPAKLSIQIIGLDGARDAAQAMAERAEARDAEGKPLTSTEVYLVTFKDRRRTQLARLFGDAFITEIETQPIGEWRAIASPKGWQAAKLIAVSASEPATIEDAMVQARYDWHEREKQARARVALDDLQARYPVAKAPYDAFIASPKPDEPAPTTESVGK